MGSTPDSQLPEDAFQIRPHHLAHILAITADMHALNLDDGDLSRLPHVVDKRMKGVLEKLRTSIRTDGYSARDLVGRHPRGKKVFIGRLVAFYRQIFELPDNHPVVIQSAIRDGICKSCIIGKHCHDMGNEGGDVLNFAKWAEAAGVNVPELVEVPHDRTFINRAQVTTMGQLRSVLAYIIENEGGPDVDMFDVWRGTHLPLLHISRNERVLELPSAVHYLHDKIRNLAMHGRDGFGEAKRSIHRFRWGWRVFRADASAESLDPIVASDDSWSVDLALLDEDTRFVANIRGPFDAAV